MLAGIGVSFAEEPAEGVESESSKRVTVVWVPTPGTDPLGSAQYLESHPHLRVTVVLKEGFFGEEEKDLQAWKIFSHLRSRDQIDLALVVPGDPLLALLQDTDRAGESLPSGQSLPPKYAWPEDVLAHLINAQSQYEQLWQADPQGIVFPGSPTGPKVPDLTLFEALDKVSLRWVLLTDHPDVTPGIYAGLTPKIVCPLVVSDRKTAGQRSVLPKLDYSSELTPPILLGNLEDVQDLWVLAGGSSVVRGRFLSEAIEESVDTPIWPGVDRQVEDMSSWIGEPEENAAWQLLGMARGDIERYKDSGKAEVTLLDAALNELYSAQKSALFYYFGADYDSGRDEELKREFLATLAQVYRLIRQPIPEILLQPFSRIITMLQDSTEMETTVQSGYGFVRWKDVLHDDRGPGDYFYPEGKEFSSGSWDIQTFDVSVQEQSVVFSFYMGSLENPWGGPLGFSLPMIDVYMDINHQRSAGSVQMLPGRPGVIDGQNAWEYALTVDGWGAHLFQYNPGKITEEGAPPKVKVVRDSGLIRVEVSKTLLRGDPLKFGYAVLVMGRAGSSGQTVKDNQGLEIGVPMPVLKDPGPGNFGGSLPNAAASPYLDLLVPPGLTQAQVLGVYKKGKDALIPFVKE
ncbi:MAG TPA: glucodextranase DOMON-like domain-containing protein [Elusimicrobiota bacterium]|nr:glucodextranase DOMON-like domain-containing protein [Elusimicrobiota bacterium]